jgi:hypothetical protein
VIESTYAYIADNALAALRWVLSMLQEHPVPTALGLIGPAMVLAVIADVAFVWIAKKVMRRSHGR